MVWLRAASRRVSRFLRGGTIAIAGAISFIDFAQAVRVYRQSSAAYERLSHLHPKDANFVYGRIAGAFLVPRMIVEHPLTGIGWGNYSLLRNTPEYRRAAVYPEDADDPGLGLFGLAAETGLPLMVILLGLLFTPWLLLHRQQAPAWLLNLALAQPLAHLFGAQLNLTYPWVVSAPALGMGIHFQNISESLPTAPELPLC